MSGWARCTPLQAIRIPGIPTDGRSKEDAVEEIDGKDDLDGHHADRTDGHKLVHRLQVGKSLVMVGVRQPAGKPNRTQNVHGIERAVQEQEGEETEYE